MISKGVLFSEYESEELRFFYRHSLRVMLAWLLEMHVQLALTSLAVAYPDDRRSIAIPSTSNGDV